MATQRWGTRGANWSKNKLKRIECCTRDRISSPFFIRFFFWQTAVWHRLKTHYYHDSCITEWGKIRGCAWRFVKLSLSADAVHHRFSSLGYVKAVPSSDVFHTTPDASSIKISTIKKSLWQLFAMFEGGNLSVLLDIYSPLIEEITGGGKGDKGGVKDVKRRYGVRTHLISTAAVVP